MLTLLCTTFSAKIRFISFAIVSTLSAISGCHGKWSPDVGLNNVTGLKTRERKFFYIILLVHCNSIRISAVGLLVCISVIMKMSV